jgi:hypothetical protein
MSRRDARITRLQAERGQATLLLLGGGCRDHGRRPGPGRLRPRARRQGTPSAGCGPGGDFGRAGHGDRVSEAVRARPSLGREFITRATCGAPLPRPREGRGREGGPAQRGPAPGGRCPLPGAFAPTRVTVELSGERELRVPERVARVTGWRDRARHRGASATERGRAGRAGAGELRGLRRAARLPHGQADAPGVAAAFDLDGSHRPAQGRPLPLGQLGFCLDEQAGPGERQPQTRSGWTRQAQACASSWDRVRLRVARGHHPHFGFIRGYALEPGTKNWRILIQCGPGRRAPQTGRSLDVAAPAGAMAVCRQS